MTIKDELLALQLDQKVLVAEQVVYWAANHPDSALYHSLEWDDTKAAQEYRIWQVRRLIAIHVVNVEGVREMVSLSIDRVNSGGGYRALNTVLESPRMRDVLLADALAELERVQTKYEALVELAQIWAAKDRVKRRASRRRPRPEDRPAAS